MVKKLFLFVCPESGCSAIAKGADAQCPRHHKLMEKKCYVLEHYKPAGSGSMEDVLSSLFKGKR